MWKSIAEDPPRVHETVMLYRKGDLYPTVGSMWGKDPNGIDPERILFTLEEGGAEDGAHRAMPFYHEDAEPTHWRPLPEVPWHLYEGRPSEFPRLRSYQAIKEWLNGLGKRCTIHPGTNVGPPMISINMSELSQEVITHVENAGNKIRADWLVGVAVRTVEGRVFSLPKPARHCEVYQVIARSIPDWKQRRGDLDGFATHSGRFFTRDQALRSAKRSGQLAEDPKHGTTLTSEDLW